MAFNSLVSGPVPLRGNSEDIIPHAAMLEACAAPDGVPHLRSMLEAEQSTPSSACHSMSAIIGQNGDYFSKTETVCKDYGQTASMAAQANGERIRCEAFATPVIDRTKK